MGFLSRLFGGQSNADPPEFVRAVDLQRAYWTHDADEQASLEARGVDRLEWRERLRLHHLLCLQRMGTKPPSEANTERCRESVRRLVAADSPYRPFMTLIWQDRSTQVDAHRPPDMQGESLNASVTHLGSLEVFRLDAARQPTRLDFVGSGELSGVSFGPPGMLRAATLRYADSRTELVFVPLLYGLSWTIGEEFDRTGKITRFDAPLIGPDLGALGAVGIGLGQQDLMLRAADGTLKWFGIGSVMHIAYPLDVRDPDFDAKARARGMDPEVARQRTVEDARRKQR